LGGDTLISQGFLTVKKGVLGAFFSSSFPFSVPVENSEFSLATKVGCFCTTDSMSVRFKFCTAESSSPPRILLTADSISKQLSGSGWSAAFRSLILLALFNEPELSPRMLLIARSISDWIGGGEAGFFTDSGRFTTSFSGTFSFTGLLWQGSDVFGFSCVNKFC